jgi:hypothetical protein
MEDANPKTCHQHSESNGTTYASNQQDSVWSCRRIDIVWCGPIEDFANGSMDSSWHLESKDDGCTALTCTMRNDAARCVLRIANGGMPAISALWLVETALLCERGSCGDKRCQSCNSTFFCQKKTPVSANILQVFSVKIVPLHDDRSGAHSIMRLHGSDLDSGSIRPGLQLRVRTHADAPSRQFMQEPSLEHAG